MRTAFVLTGLAVLVCIPALASAQGATDSYRGEFDGQPDSTIRIDISESKGESVITLVKARNFALPCDGAPKGIEGEAELSGEIDVRNTGSFKVTDDNGETTFKARGTVKARKTVGTFRFFGSVEGSDGVVRECDSGRLSFAAR